MADNTGTDDPAKIAAKAAADAAAAKAAADKKKQEDADAAKNAGAGMGLDFTSICCLVLVAMIAKAFFPDLDLSKMLPGLLGVPEGGNDNDRLKSGIKKLQGMLGMQESDQSGELDHKTVAEIQGKLGLEKTGELDKQTFNKVKGFITDHKDMLKMVGLTAEQVNTALDNLYQNTLAGNPPPPLPGEKVTPPTADKGDQTPAPPSPPAGVPNTQTDTQTPDEQRWKGEIVALQQGLLDLRKPDAIGAKLFPALLAQTQDLDITPNGLPDDKTIRGMKAILRNVGKYQNLDDSGTPTPEMLTALNDMVKNQAGLASKLGITPQVVKDVEAHYKPEPSRQPDPAAAQGASVPTAQNTPPQEEKSYWASLKEHVGQALIFAGSSILPSAEAAPPSPRATDTPAPSSPGTGDAPLPPH